MDGERFDAVTRLLATPRSRRGVLGMLAAAAGGLFAGGATIAAPQAGKPSKCYGGGSSCTNGKQCCSGTCTNRRCTSKVGSGCEVDTDCSDGHCCGGVCIPNCPIPDECHTQGSCIPSQRACSNPAKVNGSPCGNSSACDGTETCQQGVCSQGNPIVCRAPQDCEEAGVCDPATGECRFALKSAGTVCRAAVGVCDVAETCDGVSAQCPQDQFASSSTVCRAAAGACDVAGTCTGASAQCPPNEFKPAGTVCRASTGECDVEEVCTGSSAACPDNGFVLDGSPCGDTAACNGTETCLKGVCVPGEPVVCRPPKVCEEVGICNQLTGECAYAPKAAGTVCRAAAGVCDVAETCDGVSPDCPADALALAGTVCRASTGACDLAETCSGSSPFCPNDVRSPAGTVCRAAADVCDVAETCDGVSAQCPQDQFRSSSTVCRAATGPCDVAGTCTGASAQCPPNVFKPAGTVCRAAAGVCDVAETCDGVSAQCPEDQFRSSSTICRPAAGPCDMTERCTGTSPDCPADQIMPSGIVCRFVSDCEFAVCTGASAQCPQTNSFTAAGTQCTTDGNPCTNDICNGAGLCVHQLIPNC